MAGRPIKRILDIIISTIGLIVFSPIMFLTSIAILIFQGPPIIFKQTRPGLHGVPFIIYKFSTMKNLYDQDGCLLPDKDRLTRFGSWLRSTSLDELPELVNVLRGDMSIVGPRPLRLHYLGRYTPEQARRHDIKPGITGWAQVNGRNALTWEERFKLDVWYVDNWNIALDLRILLMTVWKVLKRQDISAEGHATMTEFTGAKTKRVQDKLDSF